MRCFLREDVTTYLKRGWEPYVRLSINQMVGWGAVGKVVDEPGCKSCALEASFTVPSAPIVQDDFALIDAQAGASHQTGLAKQGARLVPTIEKKDLSYPTPFLWDRVSPK